jgi:hypothetical protein
MEALCVSGFTFDEGTPDRPKFPPTKVMNDFIAGYLGAAGVTAALIRRAKEGGSYHVKICLTRNAMWYRTLGIFDRDRSEFSGEQHRLLAPETITRQTPYGELYRLAPAVKFSETPGFWEDPILMVRGSCKPEWLSSPARTASGKPALRIVRGSGSRHTRASAAAHRSATLKSARRGGGLRRRRSALKTKNR